MVLISTTNDWRLVDPLFDYIEGQPGGWSALSGDVLAAGAAGVPTNVTVRAVGDDGSAQAPSTGEQPKWVHLAAIAGGLVVVAALIAVLVARRRRDKGRPS